MITKLLMMKGKPMKASKDLKRNNEHLKGAFFSDTDRTDFTSMTLVGVIDGLLSMSASDEVERHISSQLYLYASNLQLIQDALEDCKIISHDVLIEKGIIYNFNTVINDK